MNIGTITNKTDQDINSASKRFFIHRIVSRGVHRDTHEASSNDHYHGRQDNIISPISPKTDRTNRFNLFQKKSAQRENRTLMGLRPRDFESRASTNSAIRALDSRGGSIPESEPTFKTKAYLRQQLADIVNWVHTGFTLVSVSGWIWWPKSALAYYIALLVIILVQWVLLGNRCILTDMEWRLRTGQKWRPGTDEGFVAKLIKKTGINPSQNVINKLPWYTVYACIALGLIRLL